MLGLALGCGPVEALRESLEQRAGRALLAVRYGAPAGEPAPPPGHELPWLEVPNPVVGGGAWLELWWSGRRGAVERGRRGDIAWADDGEVLFGALARPLDEGVERAALTAYRELLSLAHERGRPHLLRMWNYLPGINREDAPSAAGERGGVERYRAFNAGRAHAFVERYGAEAAARFSASSAVGSSGAELRIAFAAARAPGRHVENPRQVSAWLYPPLYGPVAPTFARATRLPPALGGGLLLSGTASVLGHETRFPGELAPQLEETLVNIDAVLDAAAAAEGRPEGPLGGAGARFDLVKVYLRERGDFDAVRSALAARWPAATPVLYLEADICRGDLRLEIEGVALDALRPS